MTLDLPQNPKPSERSHWKWAPVALLGSLLSGLAAMVFIAAGDPSFSVEPEYYQKALDWDRERAQQANNERLGYRLTVSVREAGGGARELVLQFVDAAGEPIRGASVEVSAFHNARASEIVRGRLVERQPGTYVQQLPLERLGLWELRFVAQRPGVRFTHVARVDVTRPGTRS